MAIISTECAEYELHARRTRRKVPFPIEVPELLVYIRYRGRNSTFAKYMSNLGSHPKHDRDWLKTMNNEPSLKAEMEKYIKKWCVDLNSYPPLIAASHIASVPLTPREAKKKISHHPAIKRSPTLADILSSQDTAVQTGKRKGFRISSQTAKMVYDLGIGSIAPDRFKTSGSQISVNQQSHNNQIEQRTHIGQGHVIEEHVEKAHVEQAHVEKGHVKQGHNEQRHTGQGHAEQGHNEQGHNEQGHNEQGHNEQGHAEQGHAEQGHAEQGHAEQGHIGQGLIDMGLINQGYLDQQQNNMGQITDKQIHTEEINMEHNHLEQNQPEPEQRYTEVEVVISGYTEEPEKIKNQAIKPTKQPKPPKKSEVPTLVKQLKTPCSVKRRSDKKDDKLVKKRSPFKPDINRASIILIESWDPFRQEINTLLKTPTIPARENMKMKLDINDMEIQPDNLFVEQQLVVEDMKSHTDELWDIEDVNNDLLLMRNEYNLEAGLNKESSVDEWKTLLGDEPTDFEYPQNANLDGNAIFKDNDSFEDYGDFEDYTGIDIQTQEVLSLTQTQEANLQTLVANSKIFVEDGLQTDIAQSDGQGKLPKVSFTLDAQIDHPAAAHDDGSVIGSHEVDLEAVFKDDEYFLPDDENLQVLPDGYSDNLPVFSEDDYSDGDIKNPVIDLRLDFNDDDDDDAFENALEHSSVETNVDKEYEDEEDNENDDAFGNALEHSLVETNVDKEYEDEEDNENDDAFGNALEHSSVETNVDKEDEDEEDMENDAAYERGVSPNIDNDESLMAAYQQYLHEKLMDEELGRTLEIRKPGAVLMVMSHVSVEPIFE